MNIEYVGRGYTLDDRIRGFVKDKLEKVDKFLEEPVEIRVTLEVEKHRQTADVHIAHKLGVLQAREEADDMYDALNSVVAKVVKQARRSRKKLTGRKRRAEPGGRPQQWPIEILEPASLAAGSDGPRIVRSTHLKIKPMSIDEAALELQDSKNDFVVFRDANTDKVHVLYKRRDQNYGLIAPEF
jgi:putative sigma-54 modulation protein